jgi:hypothetical protein
MRHFALATTAVTLAAACAPRQRAETVVTTTTTTAATPAAPATASAPAAAPSGDAAMRAMRPAASPRDTARGTVGGVSVLVDYGRPYRKGRTVFAADGLVPFGRVWRTGANAATTLVTSGDLTVGGTRLPAGTYTLYTVPNANAWQLVINRQTGQWGTVYSQAQDVARVPMTVRALPSPVEQFTVAVEGDALVMRWETTEARATLAK